MVYNNMIDANGIAAPIDSLDGTLAMNSYPILLRLRPARRDLFTRIILATEEEAWRLKYSFILDFVRNASSALFQHKGVMIRIGNQFMIFPTSYITDTTIVYDVIPCSSLQEFVEKNHDYLQAMPADLQEYTLDNVNIFLAP